MKWEIEVSNQGAEWVYVSVTDEDGTVLGSDTAPVVEGASFDSTGACIRSAVEQALRTGNREEG